MIPDSGPDRQVTGDLLDPDALADSVEFTELVARVLEPGGVWRIATDWDDYAEAVANLARIPTLAAGRRHVVAEDLAVDLSSLEAKIVVLGSQGIFTSSQQRKAIKKFFQF